MRVSVAALINWGTHPASTTLLLRLASQVLGEHVDDPEHELTQQECDRIAQALDRVRAAPSALPRDPSASAADAAAAEAMRHLVAIRRAARLFQLGGCQPPPHWRG